MTDLNKRALKLADQCLKQYPHSPIADMVLKLIKASQDQSVQLIERDGELEAARVKITHLERRNHTLWEAGIRTGKLLDAAEAHAARLGEALKAAQQFMIDEYKCLLDSACPKNEDGKPMRKDIDPMEEPAVVEYEEALGKIRQALVGQPVVGSFAEVMNRPCPHEWELISLTDEGGTLHAERCRHCPATREVQS